MTQLGGSLLESRLPARPATRHLRPQIPPARMMKIGAPGRLVLTDLNPTPAICGPFLFCSYTGVGFAAP
jgi:hypothetical protein